MDYSVLSEGFFINCWMGKKILDFQYYSTYPVSKKLLKRTVK